MIHSIVHHGDRGERKNSVMFFSADSGPDVIWKRSASLATGYTQDDVDRMVDEGNTESIEMKMARTGSHITWDFSPSPSLDHIELQLAAYVELHDAYPEVIIFDNLKNLADAEDGDEFRALEDACMFGQQLAYATNAAVIALHHVGGEHENGNSVVPLNGVRGKVSKTPAVIWTIYSPDNRETLRISPVKNRNGRADASGMWNIPIKADLSRMDFRG